MTRAVAAVFALLVAATFAAFFVTQRLKRTPPAVQRVMVTPFFSPNSDGRFDAAHLSFRLRRTDDITVRLIDHRDDEVRTLVDGRRLGAYQQISLKWDGRDDHGARAPDGRYRIRVTLRRQGRSILLPRAIRLDTTPPRPEVTSIGPTRTPVPRPEILPEPGGQPAEIGFRTPSTRQPTAVFIYRTDPSPGLVTQLPVKPGQTTVAWDGTRSGRRVRPGTYVVALRTRDQAGNVGSSPPVLPPRAPFGTTLPGRGGITVRYLGVEALLEPTVAGTPVTFGVDARRAPYTWNVRRVGAPSPRKRGRGTRPLLRLQSPGGVSGLYLLEVRTATHATQVPVPVQALDHHRVLVVLPAIAWQGTNPADDDGDGWPNTLTGGQPVRRERILANGLPGDLVKRVAPLLIFLDHHHLRYDLTTDLALAAGDGPQLAGHRGVLLAGDETWLPLRTQVGLRNFVTGGGRLASFGIDSLRRQVRLTPNRLRDPTAPTPADVFGAALRPLTRTRTSLTNLSDHIGLFSGNVFGGTGVFGGVDAFEATGAWPGARILASAVTPHGAKVIVAAKVGRGLVIRFGLPDLPSRLSKPGNDSQLVRRTWTLLAR